jgi:hypothetical protein
MRLDANTDGLFSPILYHDGDIRWLCVYVIGGVQN